MENQVRKLLRDIAEDFPPQREMPPTVRPRARRRLAAFVAATAIVVGALALGGVVAVRSMTGASPRPANLPNNVQLPDAPGAWQRIELPCAAENCHVGLVAASDKGLVATGWTSTASGEEFVGWSSHDGVSWQPIEGDGASWGLAAAGPGFVAVGGGSVWTSPDGVFWDRVQSNPDPRDWFQDVTAGGPGIVAVGRPNKAWYSSDGLTWQAAKVPPVPARVYPGDDGKTPQVYMTSVAAASDALVATGWMMFDNNREGPAMWVSSDGTSWRDVPLDGDVFPRGCAPDNIAGDADGFVAVGECGSGKHFVWRSADGLHWEIVGGDVFDGKTPGLLAAGPSGWVAIGDETLWTSVDGESWTRVRTGSTFRGAEASDVTAWESRLIVVGGTEDGNAVWISGPQLQT
jgi:hypothetical protein